MPDALVFGCLGAKIFGSKLILDITDMMPELYRGRFGIPLWDVGGKLLRVEERVSARAADRVLAVHELHRRRLESAGIDPSKVRVVMNSPDPAVFRPVERRRSAYGEFVVVYHGSLIRRLGIDTVIEAVAIARHAIPGLRLRIAGTGDYLDEAQALVERLALDNFVTFLGFLSVQGVAELVAGADLGVVPNHLNEATHSMLPMKLLEYAAMGVPVIAAPLKAVEFYFGSDAVRYFKSGDAGDLAMAIEELYRRPEEGAALVRRGQKAIEAISWGKQCEVFYEALDSVRASM
jgi:glycosyltransferase involved in cell wall biosynthesis